MICDGVEGSLTGLSHSLGTVPGLRSQYGQWPMANMSQYEMANMSQYESTQISSGGKGSKGIKDYMTSISETGAYIYLYNIII